MVKYTAPKYHGINTMVILWYFSSRAAADPAAGAYDAPCFNEPLSKIF